MSDITQQLHTQSQSSLSNQQGLDNKHRQKKYKKIVQQNEKIAQQINLSSNQKQAAYKQRQAKNQQLQKEQNQTDQTDDQLSKLQKRQIQCFSQISRAVQEMQPQNRQDKLKYLLNQESFKTMIFNIIFLMCKLNKTNRQLQDSASQEKILISFNIFLPMVKQYLKRIPNYLIQLWTIFGDIIAKRRINLQPVIIDYFKISRDQFRKVAELQFQSPYYRDNYEDQLIIIYFQFQQQLFKQRSTPSQNAILDIFSNILKHPKKAVQKKAVYQILFYFAIIISGENKQQEVVKMLEKDINLQQKIHELTNTKLFNRISGRFQKSLNRDNLNYCLKWLHKYLQSPYKPLILCFKLLCKHFDLQYKDIKNKPTSDLSNNSLEQFQKYKNFLALLPNSKFNTIKTTDYQKIKEILMKQIPDEQEYFLNIKEKFLNSQKFEQKLLLCIFMKTNLKDLSISNQKYYDQIQHYIFKDDYTKVTSRLEAIRKQKMSQQKNHSQQHRQQYLNVFEQIQVDRQIGISHSNTSRGRQENISNRYQQNNVQTPSFNVSNPMRQEQIEEQQMTFQIEIPSSSQQKQLDSIKHYQKPIIKYLINNTQEMNLKSKLQEKLVGSPGAVKFTLQDILKQPKINIYQFFKNLFILINEFQKYFIYSQVKIDKLTKINNRYYLSHLNNSICYYNESYNERLIQGKYSFEIIRKMLTNSTPSQQKQILSFMFKKNGKLVQDKVLMKYDLKQSFQRLQFLKILKEYGLELHKIQVNDILKGMLQYHHNNSLTIFNQDQKEQILSLVKLDIPLILNLLQRRIDIQKNIEQNN